jgi:Cu/Ag efflux pump CusA
VLLTEPVASPAARLLRVPRRAHDRALATVLRSRVPALMVVAVLLAASALVLPRFKTRLLPPLEDTNLLVHWEAPFGTSLPEMDRITARAGDELRAVPGVRNVAVQVGQASLGDRPVGSDSAEMWIRLDRSARYAAAVASVQRIVDGYPGVRGQLTTYSGSRMADVLGRTGDEISVRVFGNDLDVLHAKADEIRGQLASIDGVRGARIASRPAEPTMQVEVDLAKARQVGLKPGDVRRAAATLVSGLRVGNLFEDQKVFDVVVWSRPEVRHSLSSVRDLLIDTPSAGHVRLGDVADVSVRPTVPRIEHQDISRFVDVRADVTGRSPARVASDVRTRLARVAFPLEYHAEVLGNYSKEQAAQRRVSGFAIAAAVGVFLLLQAAFASWRLAGVGFLGLPVALSGGVLAAWIDGDTLTLATVAGLLAVLALALRATMHLFGRLHELRAEAAAPLDAAVVTQGARDALAPTLTTAAAVAVFLVPTLVSGPIAGQELLHPMAVVLLGGLVTTALATVLLLPALYLRFASPVEPEPLHLEEELEMAERQLADERVGLGSGGAER